MPPVTAALRVDHAIGLELDPMLTSLKPPSGSAEGRDRWKYQGV